MRKLTSSMFVLLTLSATMIAQAALPAPIVKGLKSPESAAVGRDGKVYVSVIGEFDKDGDGSIVVLEDGKAREFAKGLNDPKGLAAYEDLLFVADKNRVLKIDASGKVTEFAGADDFPAPPKFLNDVAVDKESGTVYVSDCGDFQGQHGAVYRIAKNGAVSVVVNDEGWKELHTPNGLALDGASHLLVADFGTGTLHRVKLANGSHEQIADGLGGVDGVTFDYHGRLFLSDWKDGRVFVIPRPGDKPVLVTDELKQAADICVDKSGQFILTPDMQAGTVVPLAANVPGAEVNHSPLAVTTEIAFPNLQWTGWQPETEQGTIVPLRPIVLTHAGDGSNRVFVATQHGVIHAFENDQNAQETKVFLDIQDRVQYDDKTNEEGFLGLAFHPKYAENGEFYVFYTIKDAPHPHTNVVSRFRVSKDDPNRADPGSEEVLLRIEHPFWNHDGGTVAFGPDGYLYIAVGDGGAANDPFGNGQNLKTLLGDVLRIDVNGKDGKKPYRIPKDNPFVGRDDALPEIYASGLRNVWRLAFDKKTGVCWAGDVGQNLWEEINLLTPGGNYGWNAREGLHPFGKDGTGPRREYIEPIWEYHHDIGKSITGGGVYRGERVPELEGAYVYADYVSGEIWALRYDDARGRVTANQSIKGPKLPIISFGEDERGDFYFLTVTPNGQGIQRFVSGK